MVSGKQCGVILVWYGEWIKFSEISFSYALCERTFHIRTQLWSASSTSLIISYQCDCGTRRNKLLCNQITIIYMNYQLFIRNIFCTKKRFRQQKTYSYLISFLNNQFQLNESIVDDPTANEMISIASRGNFILRNWWPGLV